MANVGFIVGDSTDPYSTGDTPIIDRVETTLSHTLFTTSSSSGLTAADVASFVTANSLNLIVITSSNVLTNIDDDIFRDLATPILHLEPGTWDDDEFCSSGSSETTGTYTQIDIVSPSHECAGGLSGSSVTVLSSARKLNYMKLATAASVTNIASPKSDTSKVCAWAMELGATMADATAAPERRAGMFFVYDAATVAHANAWSMFDAMVGWLITDVSANMTLSGTSAHVSTHEIESFTAQDPSATVPTLIVEFAFGIDWDTEPTAGQWTDVTTDVRVADRVTISRGRNSDLGVMEAGTCSFTLDNTSRAYEPEWASGTHYPNIRPRTHVRVKADWWGVEWPLFRGFVEHWEPQYPNLNHDGICRVTCNDLYGVLAQSKIDGGYVSSYITDATGFHWPLDETSGSTAREVIASGGTILISDKTLGHSTFATNKISRRQYPLKPTGAAGFVPSIDGGHTGELTVMGWVRQTEVGAGGAAPTAVWGSATETEEGTSCQPTLPAHADGDLIIVCFVWDASGSANETAPSGWTQIGSTLDTNNGSTSSKMALYYLNATSAAETNPTLTLDNNEDMAGWAVAITGSDGTIHASTLDPQVTDENAPAVVTTTDDAVILKFFGADGSDAPFSWASSTEKIDGETVASAIAYSAAENSQASAGTHAAEAVTYASTPPTYSTFATLAVVGTGGWSFCEMRNTAETRYTVKLEVQGDGGITVDWTNDGTTAGAVTVAGSSDINDGGWHHLAFVRYGSGTTWTVRAFLDGQPLSDAVTGHVETPWAGPTDSETFGWNLIGNMAHLSYLKEALSDVAIEEVYNAFLDTLPAQTTSERVEVLLTGYGATPAARTSLAAGASNMASENLNGTTIADAIDAAATAEFGAFFIEGDGIAVFENRAARNDSGHQHDIGTGTVLPTANVVLTQPDDHLVNVVVVTYDDAGTQESVSAVDLTALAQDGERRLDITTTLNSRVTAQGYADHILAQRKDAAMRVEAVTLIPNTDPQNMFADLLNCEISHELNVNHDPIDLSGASADIDWDGIVEHTHWSIGMPHWVLTWRVSPKALSITTF